MEVKCPRGDFPEPCEARVLCWLSSRNPLALAMTLPASLSIAAAEFHEILTRWRKQDAFSGAVSTKMASEKHGGPEESESRSCGHVPANDEIGHKTKALIAFVRTNHMLPGKLAF